MYISSATSSYYNYYQSNATQTNSSSSLSSASEMPPPPPPPSDSMSVSSSSEAESSSSDPSELMEQFSMLSSLMFNELSQSSTSSDSVLSGDHPKAQIDSLVETDLTSLTEDQVTDTLTDLQTTLSNAPYLPEVASTLVSTDLSSLSTTEQSELLSSFQEEATNISASGMGKPQGPPPGGIGGPQGIGGTESTEESEESDIADLLELLMEKLEEDEEDESLSDTQSTLLDDLKSTITSYLEANGSVI